MIDQLASSNPAVPKKLLQTNDFLTTLGSKTPSVPISRWIKENIEYLNSTGDNAMAQKISEAFKGFFVQENIQSLLQPSSPRKWFVKKPEII